MNNNILYKTLTLVTATTSVTGALAQSVSPNDLQAQRNSDRLNIVLVISEDLSPRLGCYGDPIAVTPHLDNLAKEGVRFTNVHTMAGVSSPSRSGLITGVFQNFENLMEMRSCGYKGGPYFAVPPSYIKAYPELLRRNGYYTYCDVKFDYEFSSPVNPGAFSIWNSIEPKGYSDVMAHTLKPVWRTLDLKGRPFMFNYNPQITHESGLFDSKDPGLQKWYRPIALQWDKLRAMYKIKETDPKKVSVDPFYMNTKSTRTEIARFYNNIQVMDQQVGKLIENLKADGLWDNTIFIFTTDHGDCLPRCKRDGYDSSTRVPMIIHVPDKYRTAWLPENGTTCDRLISFEDLAPTILGMSKTPIPSYMKGIDLSQEHPQARKYIFANRARQDIAQWQSYFVQDKKYEYIRNLTKDPNGMELDYRNAVRAARDLNAAYKNGTLRPEMKSWYEDRPAEEFYDLTTDPNEFHNAIHDPEYKNVIKQFRDTLDCWRDQGNDGTLLPEAQMRAELLDQNGQQRVTKQPFVSQDSINHKVYVTNFTENASIGWSLDGKTYELYTKALTFPAGTTLYVKAVRYGWKECEPVLFTVK
jgi:arylsulfatase A-like enzyme